MRYFTFYGASQGRGVSSGTASTKPMEEEKQQQEPSVSQAWIAQGKAKAVAGASAVRRGLQALMAERRRAIAIVAVIAFCLGVVAKTEAAPRLTIGFQDYLIEDPARYDLIAMEQEALENGDAVMAPSAATGGACGF